MICLYKSLRSRISKLQHFFLLIQKLIVKGFGRNSALSESHESPDVELPFADLLIADDEEGSHNVDINEHAAIPIIGLTNSRVDYISIVDVVPEVSPYVV